MTTLKLSATRSAATLCTNPTCNKRIGRIVDNMLHISIGQEEVFIRSGSKVTVRCSGGHWSDIVVAHAKEVSVG